jgi:hypothetical protein
MTVLRETTINGCVWLTAFSNGRTYVLDRLGKAGDARRPGGKRRITMKS